MIAEERTRRIIRKPQNKIPQCEVAEAQDLAVNLASTIELIDLGFHLPVSQKTRDFKYCTNIFHITYETPLSCHPAILSGVSCRGFMAGYWDIFPKNLFRYRSLTALAYKSCELLPTPANS
jgi:hypothetical protein